MWNYIHELYLARFAPRIGQLTEYNLLFGFEMASQREQAWWYSEYVATLQEEALPRLSFAWGLYTITDAILAYMLVKYTIHYIPLYNVSPYSMRICDPIPLPERLQLWDLFYHVQRDRICERLNLEDDRTTLPTEEEIRHALLQENIDDFRCAGGYFTEYSAHTLDEVVPIIKNKYQTLAYYGFEHEILMDFVLRNRIGGIDRIVPLGETTAFSLTWDGYNLINQMSRIVSVKDLI